MDRAQMPHSFVAASTFVSFDGPDRSPASTPSPPMPAAADELLAAAGALAQLRTRTLSNVSCVSNATFWSAVASASPKPQLLQPHQPPPQPQHMQHQPPSPSQRQPQHRSYVRKADSGVALDGGRERPAAARPRRPSGPVDPGRAPPPQPQPLPQPPQQPLQPPSRQPWFGRSVHRTSNYAKPLRHHASESWDTAKAITAARHAKRREIALSLGHVPSHSPPYTAAAAFTRSADSLALTRAPSARCLSSPPTSAPLA